MWCSNVDGGCGVEGFFQKTWTLRKNLRVSHSYFDAEILSDADANDRGYNLKSHFSISSQSRA